MEQSTNKENLQKWFHIMGDIGLDCAYNAAKNSVNCFSEGKGLQLSFDGIFECDGCKKQKNFFINFFSKPVHYPETLDHIVNITLLNIFLREYEFDFPFSTVKVGELNQYFKTDKLFDILCEFKQRLAEQVLFLKFLECCLDSDPADARYDFQLELSPKAEKVIFSNLDGISNDDIHNVLDGIKLFFNTSVKNIRCIPKHAAILLKVALPCWIFLALNLPSNEMPTENKISRLLKATTPEEGQKQYPAINKFLKPLCAAFYLFLEGRAGKSFAKSIVEKYELSEYISSNYEADQLLLRSQNKFVKAALQSALKRKNKPVLRGWAQRDFGTTAFDRQLQPYAASTDSPEDEFSRFIKMAFMTMDHLDCKSGENIQSTYRHLNLYQTIVSSVKCYIVNSRRFHANETLNLILLECITGLITLANFESRCPNSFYLPPLSDDTLCDLTGKPKEGRDTNPFYRLNANDPLTKHLNKLCFYENDLAILDWLRRELLYTLDHSEVADKLNQIDPMAGYLKTLLALTSPLPKTVDV